MSREFDSRIKFDRGRSTSLVFRTHLDCANILTYRRASLLCSVQSNCTILTEVSAIYTQVYPLLKLKASSTLEANTVGEDREMKNQTTVNG